MLSKKHIANIKNIMSVVNGFAFLERWSAPILRTFTNMFDYPNSNVKYLYFIIA